MASFALLMGALRESPNTSETTLEKLRERMRASDIEFYELQWRSAKEKRELRWIRDSGAVAIDAFRRCRAAKKHQDFAVFAEMLEARLQEDNIYTVSIVTEIKTLTEKLEKLCSP